MNTTVSNTKISEVENKIPDTTSLVTTTQLAQRRRKDVVRTSYIWSQKHLRLV